MISNNEDSIQIINKLNDIQNIVQNSNSTNVNSTIKVIDHVFDKLGNTLPEPTFMKESTQFALKATGGVAGCIILIGLILGIVAYVSARNTKPQKKTVEYDEDGNKKSESTQTHGEEDLCKKIYKNGKVSKIECMVTKGKYNAWKGIIVITIIAALSMFLPLFKTIRSWHYARRLRFSNPIHKTFIEYFHRLFNME